MQHMHMLLLEAARICDCVRKCLCFNSPRKAAAGPCNLLSTSTRACLASDGNLVSIAISACDKTDSCSIDPLELQLPASGFRNVYRRLKAEPIDWRQAKLVWHANQHLSSFLKV